MNKVTVDRGWAQQNDTGLVESCDDVKKKTHLLDVSNDNNTSGSIDKGVRMTC